MVDNNPSSEQETNISSDYFIKTTDDKHKIIVNNILRTCIESSDIYLGNYSGW